ncbi:MAG TPA: alpha-amylase family glycosyl hydrolase [Herpetosiphonaceae bacterium]
MADVFHWWQRGIIYQIYPRSFMDSNGDGIGDLAGISRRLAYLEDLGVDAIWISPIFPSPMVDFGYDVSDYIGIDPIFGTLDDFNALVTASHRHGLKVLLDFVPNHSSDQHPWFIESRSSRDNPKRDWYVWRDPAPDGGPPTNWVSEFGGPAWTLDETNGQYYYHAYLKEQPDVNWRNPEVRAAMYDAMRFWLDRGVDGFRIDALRQLVKDEQFRHNPPNPGYDPALHGPNRAVMPIYTTDLPELMQIIAEMRHVADDYPDRVLIGELYLPIERLMAYYGAEGRGLHLPFNFHLILTPWQAQAIADLIGRYEAALPAGGWPNWVLGNHDQHRLATRIGPAQARVAAMLLLTLRGTPTLYYGDEIGMSDVEIPPDQVYDPFEKNVPGMGLGRDPERTPMQWDASANAGFTEGTPWLPLAPDYQQNNVARELDDPASMLTLYRRLIELRRAEDALAVGEYAGVPAEGELLAYVRSYGERRLLIVLNLGSQPQTFDLSGLGGSRVRLSTHLDRDDEAAGDQLSVRPDEGLIVEMAQF